MAGPCKKCMGLLDFMKKKEVPQVPSVSEEKKLVSDITARREALRTALEKVKVADPTGKIEQEKLEQYKKLLLMLRERLVNSTVYGLDTREIDKILIYLAEHLDLAIQKGHQDTASRILKGLSYGINTGHKSVLSSDADRIDEIMEKRLDRVKKYKTIVEYSELVDDNEDNIATQNKAREQATERFAKIQKEVSEQIAANPHLVERINELGGKPNQELDPEAFELVVKKQEFNKVYANLQDLRKQIALKEATIVNCRSIIDSEEAILEQMDSALDQKMIDEVVRHEAEFRNHLVEMQNQMVELDELSNRFSYALKEIFSSPLMVDYVIGVDMEYEQIVKKMAEDEEGRKLGLEKLAELQREQESTQRIMNSN